MDVTRQAECAERASPNCHSERSEEPALRLWNRGGTEMPVLRDARDDREPRIRITLFGLACMVAILAICSCARPAGADTEKAHSAASFVDSIGINAHWGSADTLYGDRYDAVKKLLI